jgi:ParB family chromosome partitioning protein
MSEAKVERKRGLGRGFDALIPTEIVEAEFDVTAPVDSSGHRSDGGVTEIDPQLVDPNPHQPRTNFDQGALDALAASIRVHGILQPMVVTRQGSRYELIAGERRLRAAKLAGLDKVPVIIRTFDEQEKLELALIENLQRAELNPIEVATAYRKLLDQFNMRLEDLSKKIGRDIASISNTTRLLNLAPEIKRAIVDGKLVEGTARAILSITEEDKEIQEEKRLEMFRLIMKNGWNSRQAEEFARGYRGKTGSKMMAQARINATNRLTEELGSYLGTKVTQRHMAKGGRLVIEYYSDEELDRIYNAIKAGSQQG